MKYLIFLMVLSLPFFSFGENNQLVLSIDFSGTGISCSFNCDATVTATASGGVSPYNYDWSNGDSGPALDNLCPGTFIVTVTDNEGTSALGIYNVDELEELNASINTNNANCGASSGSATAVATGGTFPYNYSWSTGSNSSVITNIPTGVYTVTIQDANGCFGFAETTLGGSSAISISGSVNDVDCNGGDDGSINVGINGGTPPYSFSWDNGTSTEDLGGITAGNYNLIVSDSLGCSSGTSFEVTEPTPIVVDMQVSHAVNGENNGSILASTSGGIAPYIWQWSNGNNTVLASNLPPGTYSVVVTDANGCNLQLEATVDATTSLTEETPLESLNISPNPSLGSFQLSLSLFKENTIRMEVMNALGQVLETRQYQGIKIADDIDLSHLSNGTYFINIEIDHHRKIEKLLILR